MKLANLSFGFSAVNAGQKNSTLNAAPILIANSTEGKFSITAAVSAALGLAVGDYVQFITNAQDVKNAIQAENPILVQWCEENGIDIHTEEGANEVIKAYTRWAIAKGHAYVDKAGQPVLVSARLTKEQKNAYANEHGEEIIEKNKEALVEAATKAGETDINNPEILAHYVTEDMVDFPKVPSYAGAKTATTGSATGVGAPLNFTDTAIWHQIKADLGDNAKNVNRTFDVILKKTTIDDEEYAPFTVNVDNGQKTIGITAYPIVFNNDSEPARRNKADKD